MTTELEAINQMLSVIGETPINTLTSDTLPQDASIAVNVLEESNKAIQSEGWHFNTEVLTLTPDVLKNIIVPSGTLSIDTAKDETQDINPVDLNGKLYDLKNNTYEFSNSVKLEVISKRVWDQIPEPCKSYITRMASRKFQMRTLGSSELNQELLRDEIVSKARFIDYDSQNADRTIFDDYSVSGVMDR